MPIFSVLAFIFDIDGTLVDSNELHVDSWDRAFRRFGKEFPREKLRAQIGKGSDQYLPEFLTPEEIDRFGNLNTTLLKDDSGKVRYFNGSAGGNDTASLARRVVVIMRHEKRKLRQLKREEWEERSNKLEAVLKKDRRP